MHDIYALDPITVEVVRNKIEGIANEMQQTLLRSSFSPIVKEGLDASASLFTADGETLAQALAIPTHLAMMIPMVAKIMETFPVASMREGDVYLMNDPYLGGTHLPDIALVMPIFVEGRLAAISATITHHQDIGGMVPGSLPTNATEIFQEGLRLPPLQYRSSGIYNTTLIEIIKRNVRIPETVMGDINAELAACTVGARRIEELGREHGFDGLTHIFKSLLDRSEVLTRSALGAIPNGTYRYTDYNDNDGVELDKLVRIAVAVTVKDGSFHCDFTGSSPQVRGPFNVVPSGSLAAACFALRAITDPAIPSNGGCFRPISLHLPTGSIVNPAEPAPVNARTATIKRIAGAIFGALRGVIPDRIPADNSGVLMTLMFGGKTDEGRPFVIGDLLVGGSGASPDRDGIDSIETDVTNCMNLPVEAMEMEAPLRVHSLALRQNSGGAGERRGGLGVVKEYEILGDELTLTHRGERHFRHPAGAHGGGSGAASSSAILRTDGSKEIIPSKVVTTLRRGDRLIVETPGGGGNGNPYERPRQAVLDDVANGKLDSQSAEAQYGFFKEPQRAAG